MFYQIYNFLGVEDFDSVDYCTECSSLFHAVYDFQQSWEYFQVPCDLFANAIQQITLDV